MTQRAPAPAFVLVKEPILSAVAFRRIQKLVYERSGINLGNNKGSLVVARLGGLLRKAQCESYELFLDKIAGDASGESLSRMIDALTTNHTAFFREPAHFEWLKAIMLKDFAGRQRFDVWSAASSTGQEAYSIACTMADTWGPRAYHSCSILASDISTRAIENARKGVFPLDCCTALPKGIRERHFLKSGNDFAVRPELVRMVDFRSHNLLDKAPWGKKYPVVFLRNVLIYFDQQTQATVLANLVRAIEPGGYLLIGHSESLYNVEHPLQMVAPAVYRNP